MRLWIAILVGAVLVLAEGEDKDEQEKKKKKKPPGAAEIKIDDPGVPVEDAGVARQEVVRFEKEFKAARKDRDKRIKLLVRLGGFDHPLITKAAAKKIKSRDWKVSVAAVVAVARQSTDKKKAGGTLLSALRREKRTNVVCACLVGMGKLGFKTQQAIKSADLHFRRDTKQGHIASARYFGYIKSKEHFRLLAEKLDEPRPAPVKRGVPAPNPSASLLRERWYEWKAALPYIRWALSQMVPGESFDTREEAKGWAETEGKKHGITW